jgi:deoxyribodipyrimidine photo-lyase
MQQINSIFWFRQDLRLTDNPALTAAATNSAILPIYILDDLAPTKFSLGDCSKAWLYYALQSLNKFLDNKLNYYLGDPSDIIIKLIRQYNIKQVFINRCYEPWYLHQEKQLAKKLASLQVELLVYNGNYLWDPQQILKDDGSYYKVYSAYKRKACLLTPEEPWAKPKNISVLTDKNNKIKLDDFNLLTNESWEHKVINNWQIGEQHAWHKLQHFIRDALADYKRGRDYPALNHTSKLSPYLHFGEISPRQIWHVVMADNATKTPNKDTEHFISELIWREFSCYLLYHFPGLARDNFQPKFNQFPWRHNKKYLTAWQRGQTGYPIIDAGMRQLWQTGYMHNRVRMIVASFLVKNLFIHWHAGRDWFWDCLVDADLANNSAGWQWVAGCGADAAPYFRIFNPITQGEKFDPDGEYTRKFVPELQNLPNKYLFKPWQASAEILRQAGIILGSTYPKPIIDLAESRELALSAYKKL